jgi:hypothetical protein
VEVQATRARVVAVLAQGIGVRVMATGTIVVAMSLITAIGVLLLGRCEKRKLMSSRRPSVERLLFYLSHE